MFIFTYIWKKIYQHIMFTYLYKLRYRYYMYVYRYYNGHKGGWCAASPIQPVKCTVVFYTCTYVLSYIFKNCIGLFKNWNLGQPIPGNVPIGWSDEGVYKHSTGEDWASNISRLRTWDWDGPHCVCTSHTPMIQVILYVNWYICI
jgi:hypothetical protein